MSFLGRWHVDRKNSFFWREAGLAGLVQIARLGQMPLQQAARTIPGTLITSMQLARAVAAGAQAVAGARQSWLSLPPVPHEPTITGIFAARPASSISRKSRLSAESENSVSPEPR